ncbi:MAG: hypothetical protein VKI42_06665 [Synechococcaceae cyanobacterium]|nr:hypothetical protein [Synechococcaceae cyanobacterium]
MGAARLHGLGVIDYGIVQGSAAALRRARRQSAPPGVAAVQVWSAVLTAIPALIAITLRCQVGQPGVAMVANPAGRRVDILLSGAMVPVGGMQACLWTSRALVAAALLVGSRLPTPPRQLQAARRAEDPHSPGAMGAISQAAAGLKSSAVMRAAWI